MKNIKTLSFRFVVILLTLTSLQVSTAMAQERRFEERDFPLPVSINALMVTMLDHSAHYIWDYAALEETMLEEEWAAVEYYAIQLAAGGPLITLGGTGEFDNGWVSSPQWLAYSMDMSNAAMKAKTASRLEDKELLMTAGDELLDSCLGCHDLFKPEIPSEGMMHNPSYDRLYHLFERDQ